MNGIRISRLYIRNFRGIAERDVTVPPAGMMASGRNGGGKTSVLNAIRAALTGKDIGADAVRHNAEKAEILVDLDEVRVRRTITAKGGGDLKVLRGGEPLPKPQTVLNELLGLSAFDPLDLITKKDKRERRKAILAALPITVTAEEMAAWAPGIEVDCNGHGLEVVEAARERAYNLRKAANAAAKTAAAALEHARENARRLPAVEVPDVYALMQRVAEAHAAVGALQRAREESGAVAARAQATTERVARLRADAAAARGSAPTFSAEQLAADRAELEGVGDAIAQLREQLRALEQKAETLRTRVAATTELQWAAEAASRRADDALVQAAALEATLAELAPPPAPTDEEIEAARAAAAEAARAAEAGKTAAAAAEASRAAAAAVAAAEREAQTTQARADELDAIVERLSKDVPRQLLVSNPGIGGLSLAGDDIVLDGVSLDALCGCEQVNFAVEVAKRVNSMSGASKLLLVDGLERLDPEQMDAFVKAATSDGHQLIATRVDRGDVVIHGFTAEEAEAAE